MIFALLLKMMNFTQSRPRFCLVAENPEIEIFLTNVARINTFAYIHGDRNLATNAGNSHVGIPNGIMVF